MQLSELKNIISDQHQQPPKSERIITRDIYPQLKAWKENPQIIIMMGIRRCGKSTLLQTIRQESKEQDYYVNFDDDRLATFKVADFQQLLEALYELYGEQKTFFFDEIQNIAEWERFIRRLHDQGNKIYITGSNASMFSKELGTRLTGRYLPITVYPFSFKEFIRYKDPNIVPKSIYSTKERTTIKRLFHEYCIKGGMPEYLQHEETEYLHTLYENILYKDVIVRYKLTNEKTIKSLVYYLVSNIAKDTSFNAIRKLLNVGNATTIAEYSHYLESSFLCFMINRYSHSLKKQQGYLKKTYCIDTALARTVGFRHSEDRGRLLENVVFLELLRRDGKIFFHKEKQECDFIIKKDFNIVSAIQVCVSLEEEKTRKREIGGLLEAMQNHSLTNGYILTEDKEERLIINDEKTKKTIHIVPIWKWLQNTPLG